MPLFGRRAMVGGVMLAALALTGCLRPLYGPDVAGVTMSETLSAVAVDLIPGRVGQQVRNGLLFRLTGGGEAAAPRWTLAVTVTTLRTTAIVDVRTGEPQLDAVTLTGRYVLKALDGETIDSGEVLARTSLDRTLQRFASQRAVRDAEDRAAEQVADQIRTRLAIRLARGA